MEENNSLEIPTIDDLVKLITGLRTSSPETLFKKIEKTYEEIIVGKLGILTFSFSLVEEEKGKQKLLPLYDEPAYIFPVSPRDRPLKWWSKEETEEILNKRGAKPEFHQFFLDYSEKLFFEIPHSEIEAVNYRKYVNAEIEVQIIRNMLNRDPSELVYFGVLLQRVEFSLKKESLKFYAYAQGTWLRKNFSFDLTLPYIFTLWHCGASLALETHLRKNIEKKLNEAHNKEKALFAEKKMLFDRIHAPLNQVIEDMRKSNSLLMFIERQINPPWQSFPGLSKISDFNKIFDPSAEIKVGSDTYYGLHDYLAKYEELSNSTKENLKGIYQYLIKLIFPSKPPRKDKNNVFSAIKSIFLRAKNSQKYECLKFLKFITYDSSDPSKPLNFVQILFFILLSLKWKPRKQGNVKFMISGNWVQGTLRSGKDGLLDFLNGDLWKETSRGLTSIKSFLKDAKTINVSPTVALEGNISPGEFCSALARLVSEELQGEKLVKVSDIYLASLGEGRHIGITIKCLGTFEENSLIREESVKDEFLFHGLRNALLTIEKAVDSKRKFNPIEPTDLNKFYYPFSIFESTGKTIFRIVLGNIYNPFCEYSTESFWPKGEKI